MITCRKTILTSASGTGSVNLPVPVGQIGEPKVVEGQGEVALEAMGTAQCRLMVTGGILDGEVTVTWREAA